VAHVVAPALSVALRGRDGGATAELGGEQAGTLRASSGGGDKPYVLVPHAVVAPPLTATSKTGRSHWEGSGVHPTLNQSKNIGGVGLSNQELFSQRGAYLVGDPHVAHVVAPPLTATNDPSRSPQSAEVTAQVHAVLRAQYPEVADVCGTISDGAHHGGGLNGQDAYTGRILPVAFDARQHDVLIYGDKTGLLDTDGSSIGVVVQPVAFTENHEGRVYEHDYIGALNQGGGKPGMCYPAIRTGMSVRRLTPTECERLQGFPDGWTAIPWKGKSASECPDGPRYKALGNSMACNVMRWIGARIQAVEEA
jgi:DNA (cytosine-5)-methyltransferase 1